MSSSSSEDRGNVGASLQRSSKTVNRRKKKKFSDFKEMLSSGRSLAIEVPGSGKQATAGVMHHEQDLSDDNFEPDDSVLDSTSQSADITHNSSSSESDLSDDEHFHDDDEEFANPDRDDPDDPDDPHNSESSGDESDQSDEGDAGEEFSFCHESLNAQVRPVNIPTLREVLLLDLAQMVRHKLSYEALISGFENKNALYGKKYLPTSKKELWRILGRKNSGVEYHVYCDKCGSYIGKRKELGDIAACREETCMRNVATSKAKYFATISIRKQLKHLLNTPGIAELLKYRDNRHKHSTIGIEDVYDAECYKKMQEEGVLGPYDLTATINTDGCRSTKGATKETFPVFLRINEFPPHLRQRFMMLAAVYIDKEQPVMNTLLLPVVEELNKLSSRGVPRPAEGQQVESKLIVKCFCVDGKARGQVLNMDTHQSYNGCTYCDIRGVLVEDGESKKRTMRWPAYSDDPIPLFTDRNDRGMKDSMLLATQTRQVVQGHKGTSALMLLDHMDLRSGNCVDDLHVIYECAAPHITELILTVAPRQDKRMSDERLLSTIDERMKLIKSPSSISRKPGSCSIKNRKKFKGTQWRDWLIHYSLPCLEGLIENEHLQLLELLSRGAFLLSQDIILPEHIMEAETCFSEFLVLNQQIYGLSKTKLNLHTLVHAGRCVRENGGLWCYSTVNFESWNNKVIKCVMSPAGALLQIVVRHQVHMALSSAVSSHELFSPNVRAQLMKTLQKRRLVHVIKMSDDVYLAGRPKRRKVTNAENQVLSDQGFDNIEEVEEFDKILIRSTPFGIGNRRSLSDNSMIYTYSDIFCSIQSILKFQLQDGSEKCGLYVVHHQVGRLPFRYAKHIAVLSEDQDKFYFVSPEDVRMPCVKSKILGRTYVSPLPNSFEID